MASSSGGVMFKKSSFSATNVTCVEVEHHLLTDTFLIRDSKDVNSPVLIFTREEWESFIKWVNNHEFD
jgi:Domain of unknown function (DUF397)